MTPFADPESTSKASALPRGKLDGFSADRLFRFIDALGKDVEIVSRRRPGAESRQGHEW